MQIIQGRKVYVITKLMLNKYIKYTLLSNMVYVQKNGNVLVEQNLENKTYFDVTLMDNNTFWENWLDINEI